MSSVTCRRNGRLWTPCSSTSSKHDLTPTPLLKPAASQSLDRLRDRAVELTNLGWSISQESLQQSAGLEEVELVNDFAVLIYGLPHFSDSQQITLQKGSRLASEGTQVRAKTRRHSWSRDGLGNGSGTSKQHRMDCSTQRGWSSRVRSTLQRRMGTGAMAQA